MAAVGGILKTLTIDGRTFKGGGPVTLFLGGNTKTFEPVANGKVTNVKPELWEAKSLKVLVDPNNQDLEYLNEVSTSTEDKPCAFELMDGNSYSGTGSIIERVEYNSEGAMAEFTMQGNGDPLEQL